MSYSTRQLGTHRSESGFTLLSMLVTIVALSVIGAVALESLAPGIEQARQSEAERQMQAICRALAGSYTIGGPLTGPDFGYIGDVGAFPASLSDLSVNPGGYTTWRGPYLRPSFAEAGGSALLDPWGTPYNYTSGTVVTSTGSGSTLTHPVAGSSADLLDCGFTGTTLGANGVAPGAASTNVIIIVTYPDGAGGYRLDTTSVTPTGQYSFPASIPIGVHRVNAYDTVAIDSAETYIRLLPRSNPSNTQSGPLRFSSVSY